MNVTAPEPVTNKELSQALGRVLRRPAFAPVPALAVKALYGEMAQIVTTGQRAVPAALTTSWATGSSSLSSRHGAPRDATRGASAPCEEPPHSRGSFTRNRDWMLSPRPGRPLTLHQLKRPVLGCDHRAEGMADHPAHGAAGVGQVARDGGRHR